MILPRLRLFHAALFAFISSNLLVQTKLKLKGYYGAHSFISASPLPGQHRLGWGAGKGLERRVVCGGQLASIQPSYRQWTSIIRPDRPPGRVESAPQGSTFYPARPRVLLGSRVVGPRTARGLAWAGRPIYTPWSLPRHERISFAAQRASCSPGRHAS